MRNKGFTITELIVTVVSINIMVAIAASNVAKGRDRASQASVKGNMHKTQICIEAYAADFGGFYPQDDNTAGLGFGYYFPGGDDDLQTVLGAYPTNPYTGAQMVPGCDFNCGAYANSGDNSDQTIGGPNDWCCGTAFAGQCRYMIWPAGGPRIEWGLIGVGKDGLSIRGGSSIFSIFVLHN